MSRPGAWHCVEALGLLVSTGRSAEFGASRRKVTLRAEHERALKARDPLVRARALRLLGRGDEARVLWTRALSREPSPAEAWAGLWELGLAASAGRGADLGRIDEAARRGPDDARWRAWRALGLLLSRPRAEYALAPRGINRVARSQAARAAARAALAEARRAVRLDASFALGPVAAALACEDLGRPSEAVRWFGRAAALAPKEGWLLLARADARRRAGDLAGFVADATAAHYLDEGAGALRFAVDDPRRDSAPRAIAGATRLLSRRPRAAWALALRADLKRYPEVNDFPGALADFEAAARLAPREAWIRAYLSRARITAGDFDGALDAVNAAARLRPDCGWIRAWKGEVLRRFGRFAASARELDAALRLDPGYEFALAWRGGTRRALGRNREALADLTAAAALDPSYAWTVVERHSVLRALGRVDEAFDDLERARRLDPKSAWCARPEDAPSALAELDRRLAARPRDARAWAWRGETRLRAGDPAGAERDLARAAEFAPGPAWARAARGEALTALGRPAAAVREFDAALAAEPGLAEAAAGRGRARLDAGDARGALADLSAAAAREPRASWIHAARGEAALRLKRWDEAREAFRQSAALERGDARSLLGETRALRGAGRSGAARRLLGELTKRARSSTASGRHDEAEALSAGVLSLDPKNREAWAVRAEALRCLGRHDEAVAAHDRLVALANGSAEARLSRGAARRAAGDFAGALTDAAAALKKRPRSSSAWILKSEALRNLGREAAASLAAARACALEPRRSWAWTVRAKAARQAGALGEALTYCARACALDPRDAKAAGWKGDVLRALGRLPEARRALERAAALAPTVAWPKAVLAEVLRERGDAAGAVSRWTEALTLDPRCSAAYDVLGGEPAAVKSDPGRAWAYAWRASARRAAGDARGAAADFARARRLAPGLFAAAA